ncbi:MAG: hypothetical protein KDA38_04135, partial [Planctomycetales bacterium]|nr:hypothetical protein [Planctomycetales bacterium]
MTHAGVRHSPREFAQPTFDRSPPADRQTFMGQEKAAICPQRNGSCRSQLDGRAETVPLRVRRSETLEVKES